MTNIKRAAGLALILLMSVTAVMPVQAYGHKKWTIGYEENKNGPEKKEQGANGWYFMYTGQTGAGGQLDTSLFTECVWADTGSCWMWYDYDDMWVPDIYAAEGYDCLAVGGWWRMDGNGIMDPNVTEGAVSSVIAWEAPEYGKYSVNVNYTAGSVPYTLVGKEYEDGDGLTMSFCTDEESIDQAYCGAAPKTGRKVIENLTEGTFEKELTLQKGERVYICADPGGNGGSDMASVKAEIIQKEGESVQSFYLTLLAAGIAVVIFCLTLTVIIIFKQKKEDTELLVEAEEDEE